MSADPASAGRLRKRFLHMAEHFGYAVAGLPMALRYLPRHSDPAPARYLHEVHAREYWRLPWGLLLGLAAALLWLPALVAAVTIYTLRNGAAIRARSGVPVIRQVTGQLHMAAAASIAPMWFYMFELFDEARRAEAHLFLTAHETIGPVYGLLQPAEGFDALTDKVEFAAACATLGVQAVPVLLHLQGGGVAAGSPDRLPPADLFIKPRSGSGGHHMERWDHQGGSRYRSSAGEMLEAPALLARLMQLSRQQDFVVQPRLENHPALADIGNGALATARILTCRNEAGGYEATNAAFRMAVGRNSVVDNFHQGGLATAVDLATGDIGAASDMGVRPGMGWREDHPVSGARFAGRRLPHWQAAVRLACAAHAAFPQHVVVGWDVAMLAEGPCLIEGNARPDLDIHQRVERRPLGASRIAALLAFNLRRRGGGAPAA